MNIKKAAATSAGAAVWVGTVLWAHHFGWKAGRAGAKRDNMVVQAEIMDAFLEHAKRSAGCLQDNLNRLNRDLLHLLEDSPAETTDWSDETTDWSDETTDWSDEK